MRKNCLQMQVKCLVSPAAHDVKITSNWRRRTSGSKRRRPDVMCLMTEILLKKDVNFREPEILLKRTSNSGMTE